MRPRSSTSRTILALFTMLALSACAQAPPEQQIVNDAATALGGIARVQAVKTIVIEGTGTNGNLGQDMTPDATSQAFNLTGYKRAIDVAGGRMRIEQTRTPTFAYFQGQQSQKQVLGIDGGVGYNIAPNGTATRVANAAAGDRRADLYHHPLTIVRAALDAATVLSNPRTHDNERIVDVALVSGLKFTLAIDSATKSPTRVVSMSDNLNLGDVAIETSFTEYQDVNGMKLPARLTTKTDRWTTVDIKVSRQSVDGDTGDLAAPQAATSAAAIAGPPPAVVTAEEIAKGVWFLAGQSHHSVLVEFADHLTLIETPQNDTRALAVIAKARTLRPDKPLTTVVNTHHHFDHSGGVRAAVSEGLALITQKANAAFYQDAVSRSHSIVPDALSKNPKPLKMQTVDDELILKDGAMTVALYRIVGSPHADTLLMAYFPNGRLLVEADVFSPGSAVQPYTANLMENIRTHDLKIDRIVPIHGAITPYSEFLKAVPKP